MLGTTCTLPLRTSIYPNTAESNDDLPAPTAPHTPRSVPLLTVRVIDFRVLQFSTSLPKETEVIDILKEVWGSKGFELLSILGISDSRKGVAVMKTRKKKRGEKRAERRRGKEKRVRGIGDKGLVNCHPSNYSFLAFEIDSI